LVVVRAHEGGAALRHVDIEKRASESPLNDQLRGLSCFLGLFTTQICITVTGNDGTALRAARVAAEADADLVELRLDSMERPDADAALAGRGKPAIVTCRPRREGGMFAGSEEERLRILRRAHDLGAEFIDIEWDADAGELMRARGNRGTIVSRHVFAAAPDAAALLDDLRRRGGELAKLAVMAERPSDLVPLLRARRDDASLVIGMGGGGLPTRILAGRFGSRWTYAGNAVAPGQITPARLLHEFRFRRIRPDAAVYAVLGRPVAQSLSPAMHNAGFAARGLNAAYVPLEVRDLDGLRAFGDAIGLRGASVTIPFKTDVLPLLDELDASAAAAGAVNTIAVRDGRWVGLNTDMEGFLRPLRALVPDMRGLRAVILGAGGAARGVALALRREGAEVAIAARRDEAGATVAQALATDVAAWPPRAGSWDLLVNATPVGSRGLPGTPYAGPFDGRLVYDLVYDPVPTELVRAAAASGCAAIGGLEMLAAQAERQFEIWTGQRPGDGVFMDAARSALARRPAQDDL
jgi:3-dehydroquinate dehydratase/shikimate dehydrogenase